MLLYYLFRYCDLTDLEYKFAEYLRKLMLRKEEWAHCFLTVGHHTNNIVEAAFRILKDTILERTRAYNVGHLIEFVGFRLDRYYMRRFMDAANGRQLIQQRSNPAISKVDVSFMYFVIMNLSEAIT